MIDITIKKLVSDVETGYIKRVEYEARGRAGHSIGVLNFLAAEEGVGFKPFAEVTEADVHEWIKSSSAFLLVDDGEDTAVPQESTALPWAQ